MRILLTGCKGMLGSDLTDVLTPLGEVTGVDIEQGDLTNPGACAEVFHRADPDVVVNAAAFTDVDGCENAGQYETAYAANAQLPQNLSMLCAAKDALLVHISSDYVYDGEKKGPYTEEDIPNPLSAYGRMKYAGDLAVMASGCRHLILRTSWLFGRNGANFVETILRLAEDRDKLTVVDDQRGCPTHSLDLAKGIKKGLEAGIEGLYHLAGTGETTWFGFAEKICTLSGASAVVEPISTAQFPRPARRPANSALDCSRFREETGYTMPSWENALAEFLSLTDRLR